MQIRPPWLRWMLLAVAWAVALGGLALGWASLGGLRSQRLDMLTHFAPAALAAGLIALLLWFFVARRTRLLFAAAVLALVPPLALMGPELARATGWKSPAPPGAEQIRVLQFNLWSSNTDPEATLAYILKADADIVLLQEAQGQAVPIVEALAERYPHSVSCYWGYHCDPRVLLKKPPLAISRENPGPKGTESTDIGQVVWVRTTTPRGVPFTAVSLHLGWPTPFGNQSFDRTRFLRELATLPREGLIIGGDFNSTPWSFAMRRQDRAVGLPRRTRAVATWPAPFPVIPIDHLYAGPEWRTVSIERGPWLGSDHRAILTTLAYSPRPG